MKFSVLPVHSLEDVTLDLEQLQALNLGRLTWGLFITGTGVVQNVGSGDWSLSALASGTATLTFPARVTVPALVLGANAAGNIAVQSSGLSRSSAVITTFVPSTLATTNANVSFVVIG